MILDPLDGSLNFFSQTNIGKLSMLLFSEKSYGNLSLLAFKAMVV